MIKKENRIISLIVTHGLLGLVFVLLLGGFVARIYFWDEINNWMESFTEKYSLFLFPVGIIMCGSLTLWQIRCKKDESESHFSPVKFVWYAGGTFFFTAAFILKLVY